MLTDFRKLVLPSRTLLTAIEVAGLIEATLDGVPGIFYRSEHAVTNSYTVHICFLTLSNVFACCGQDTEVQAVTKSRRQETFDFRIHCHARIVPCWRHTQGRLLCLPFFAFLVAGLPAGSVAASSARSSWAARSA